MIASTQQLPTIGIHKGVSFDDYAAWPAVNNSLLGRFAKSAKHARRWMTHQPESTEAQEFGQATHCAVLEPERFAAEFVGAPKIDRRTAAGKAAWAAFQADNADRIVLTADELDLCGRMRDAVHEHQMANELLTGKGINEVCAVWQHEGTGLLCKARMDRFCQWNGWPCVVDIKTTIDPTPQGFVREVAKYAYHRQAAFYLDGLNTLAPLSRRFLIIAIEKTDPFDVVVHELDMESMEAGRRDYQRLLARCKAAQEENRWAGSCEGINTLYLPSWATSGMEEVA